MNWTTAYGRSLALGEMSHGHLSNVLWFFDIFYGSKKRPHPAIQMELNKRFSGIRLPYMPLIVFKKEIEELVSLGITNGKVGDEIILHGNRIGYISDERTKSDVFTDVNGWKAIGIKEEDNDKSSPYWIYNSSGKLIAFLYFSGRLDLMEYFDNTSFTQKDTGMKFNPKTELKQAVRYAFLKTQVPFDKKYSRYL